MNNDHPKHIHKTNSVKTNHSLVESINDLRDLEYNGVGLSPQQRLAVKNYDRYRISVLNSQVNEEDFHKAYMKLQVLANLSPYQEFLKEEYYS